MKGHQEEFGSLLKGQVSIPCPAHLSGEGLAASPFCISMFLCFAIETARPLYGTEVQQGEWFAINLKDDPPQKKIPKRNGKENSLIAAGQSGWPT